MLGLNLALNKNQALSSLAKKAGAVWQLDSQKIVDINNKIVTNKAPTLPLITITLTNLFGNLGNFINPITNVAEGWINNSGDSVTDISCINNIQTFTGNASGVGIDYPLQIPMVAGHRYYVFGYQKNSGSDIIGSHFRIYADTVTKKGVTAVIGDTWKMVSTDYTADGTETHIKICPTGGGCRVDNKLFFYMDITDLGYSKERMDDIIREQMNIEYFAQREVSIKSDIITLENLLPQGNMVDSNENGIADGWTGSQDNMYVENNVQYFTPKNQYGAVGTTFNAEIGTRFYYCGYIKTTTAGVRLSTANTTGTTWVNITNGDTYRFASAIAVNTGETVNVYVSSVNLTTYYEIAMKNMFVIKIPSAWGTNTEMIKAYLDEIMQREIVKGFWAGEKEVKNDAVMINFAMTRDSGFRNFDKRVLKLHNLMGEYGRVIDSDSDGLADSFTVSGYSTNRSVVNGIQSFTPTAQYGAIMMTPKQVISGHKFYIGVLVKSLDASTNIRLTGFNDVNGNLDIPGTGSFQLISALKLMEKPTGNINAKIQTSRTSEFSEIQFTKWVFFDITEDFADGEYPEPTEIEMNNMMKDWFESNSGYFDNQPNAALLRPTVHFDGVDDLLNILNSIGLDITTAPLAVFATVKPSDGALYILAKNLTYDSIQYAIRHQTNQFVVALNTSTFSSTTGSVPLEEWKNIGFIWDGSVVKLYVDQNTSGGWGEFTGKLISQPYVRVGCRGNTSTPNGGYFKGDISTVTVYTGEKATEANILKEEARISKRYITGGE